MGDYQFVKRNWILKEQIKEEEPPERKKAFNGCEKFPPEQIQKRPRVLVIESDPRILLVIEDALKTKCDVRAYRIVHDVENGFELAKDPVDFFVIGPMFTNCPEILAVKIRKSYPETKIIKLATTAECKRFTSEFAVVSGDPIFDDVLQFSRLGELEKIIANLFSSGNAGG